MSRVDQLKKLLSLDEGDAKEEESDANEIEELTQKINSRVRDIERLVKKKEENISSVKATLNSAESQIRQAEEYLSGDKDANAANMRDDEDVPPRHKYEANHHLEEIRKNLEEAREAEKRIEQKRQELAKMVEREITDLKRMKKAEEDAVKVTSKALDITEELEELEQRFEQVVEDEPQRNVKPGTQQPRYQ